MTCASIDSRPMRVRRAQLAVDFLARVLGQVELVELLAQLLELVVRAALALAELLLDRLHLLAQVHLALALAELLLHLAT